MVPLTIRRRASFDIEAVESVKDYFRAVLANDQSAYLAAREGDLFATMNPARGQAFMFLVVVTSCALAAHKPFRRLTENDQARILQAALDPTNLIAGLADPALTAALLAGLCGTRAQSEMFPEMFSEDQISALIPCLFALGAEGLRNRPLRYDTWEQLFGRCVRFAAKRMLRGQHD